MKVVACNYFSPSLAPLLGWIVHAWLVHWRCMMGPKVQFYHPYPLCYTHPETAVLRARAHKPMRGGHRGSHLESFLRAPTWQG